MRVTVLLAASLLLAGCADVPAAESTLEDAIDLAAASAEAAEARAEANATAAAQPPPVAPSNMSMPPPALDPCSLPLAGLDDPCLADGFHFGEAAFWDGGSVPSVVETGFPATCAATTGCTDLVFDVAETAAGARLRVDAQVFFKDPSHIRTLADTCLGIDFCGLETGLLFALFPPGVEVAEGNEAATGSTQGAFAATLFVGGHDLDTREPLPGPEVGTWTLRLNGQLPDGVAYRMRAKLEAPTPPSDALAYPDLRIIPPFEVGFMVPTTSFQPGLPTPTAVPVAGCMPEEYVEAEQNGLERPTLCLRFSMGFANAGDGNWRLKMLDEGAAAPMLPTDEGADIPVVQSVCTADGRDCRDLPMLDGLVTRWDEAHGHYHYQNAYVFDLYRVTASEGGSPALELLSTSGKLGIDPGPEAFVGWTTFGQLEPWGPVGQDASGTEAPADKTLNAGWGDVYDWNRAGNYVPFPSDPAGRPVAGEYLIRGVTDPDGHIVEKDDANNQAYTHFRVDDLGGVEILERGHGLDPWDASKDVLDVTP